MVVLQMGWAFFEDLFLVTLSYVLIFAVIFGPPLLLGWGCWRLFRENGRKGFGEALLLVLTAALMVGQIWLFAARGIERRDAKSHMRAALIRCGEMLKNGEREVLTQKLAAFTGSPEMELELVPFSVAFRKAVGAEEPPPERWDGEDLLSCGFLGVLYLALIGVWAVMLGRGAEPRKRRGYLSVLAGLSLCVLMLVWLTGGILLGYNRMWVRSDVRKLAEAVSGPEVQPELLPQLENPGTDGLPYIRLPLRRGPENEER